MRPNRLKSRIFVDGGDPDETKEILDLCGFVDGQTTNPTLISRNPVAKERMDRGEQFKEAELLDFYRDVVQKISRMTPQGSISVEVYADKDTSAEQMVEQGREMFSWIPNAHIKYPTSKEGLRAAQQAVQEGIRVNMTLCFQQEQAAAVYAATQGASKGDVFVSPFVGRLDDRGENGMDLIAHILRMYQQGDGHVEVLTASVRTMDHFLYALWLGSDIITAPFKVLKRWGEDGLPIPGGDYRYPTGDLQPIPYQELDLTRDWETFNIDHDLTVKGMASFSADWNALMR
jgi:transaldolase